MATNIDPKMVLIVLGILTVAAILSQFGDLSKSVAGGFTTLSISPADILSNDPTLNGKAIVLNVIADGSGEYASGTLSKGTTLPSNNGVTANDFTIQISAISEQCTYPLERINTALYTFYSQQKGFGSILLSSDRDNAARTWCDSLSGTTVGYIGFRSGNTAYIDQYYCVKASPTYSNANILQKRLDWNGKVIFKTSDGKQVETPISNTNPLININNVLYGKWVGSITSGEYCPETSQAAAIYATGQQTYKIIDAFQLSQYRTKASNINYVWTCINNNADNVQRCINEQVAAHDAAVNSLPAQFRGYQISGSNAVMPLSKLIQYPQFQFIVKADWIGINIPVADIKLLSCSKAQGPAAQNQVMNVEVQNTGLVDGTASFRLMEPCTHDILTAVNTYLIPANSKQTYQFVVQSSTEAHEVCNLQATNRVGTTSAIQCRLDSTVPSSLPTVTFQGGGDGTGCPTGYKLSTVDNIKICIKESTGANISAAQIVLVLAGLLILGGGFMAFTKGKKR